MIGHRLAQHRHDPFAQVTRVSDLAFAEWRLDGRGRDHEQERVGLLDGAADCRGEYLAIDESFGVQPSLLAALLD